MKLGGGKQKGNRFEREIASRLSAWWEESTGIKKGFARTPGSGGWAKTSGTAETGSYVAGDIVCPKSFPFVVECKDDESFQFHLLISSYEKSSFKQWWEKLCGEAEAVGKYPLLVFTRNRWPRFCCMREKDFRSAATLAPSGPVIKLDVPREQKGGGGGTVVIFQFDDFLASVYLSIVPLIVRRPAPKVETQKNPNA